MLTIEQLKDQFRGEGFASVYDWQDKPNTTYPPHQHRGKVSMYVVEGDILFNLPDREVHLKAGDRFDVPVGIEHSANVGQQGCISVVGEEIEGDS